MALSNKTYDLLERSSAFGETIILFVQSLSNNPVIDPLKIQLLRSGTSIGANYMEADGAESKADFRHKIAICRKESKETLYWLRMIAQADPRTIEHCRKLYKEAHELTLIFSSILLKKGQ